MNSYFLTLLDSVKSKLAMLLFSCLSLLAPIQFILLLVGFFIVLDTISGIFASKKLKLPITSRKLSRFITKMLVYQLVVITFYALDVNLLGEFLLKVVSIKLVLTKTIAIALVINELYSIDEKIRLVNKGKGLWFFFKQMISTAKIIKKEGGGLMDEYNNKE